MSSAAQFFERLSARHAAAPAEEVLWLSIQGYVVRVEFRGMPVSDVMRLNLQFLLCEPQEQADELLCVWQDDFDEILPHVMLSEEELRIHFHQTDEYHLIWPGTYRRLSARDDAAHVTYICYERGEATPEICATKPFTNEMQWWLWGRQILLHAGAVGAGGRGALIAAPSGGGKSTLTLAALSAGMDFISEDFLLMPWSGPAVGHAAFPTGNLLPDTLERLPQFKNGVLTYMEGKGKYVVDLTGYGKGIAESLPLDVLILPRICNASEPKIVPLSSVRPYMMAAVSAAKQVKARANLAESVQAIMARLKGIPAYEMHLSADLDANVAALRTFLVG